MVVSTWRACSVENNADIYKVIIALDRKHYTLLELFPFLFCRLEKTRIVNDVLLGLVNRQIRDSSVCCVRFYYVKPFMLLRMLPYAGPTENGKSKNQP